MSVLQEMLDKQLQLQEVMPPFPTRATSTDPQTICEYIKDMVFACEDELHELTAETGWKPWTSKWHVNYDAARGEWIDAWHFMMNLANILGMNEEMIADMYWTKHDINRNRQSQEGGYDGVSGKCPACHRALDDPAVKCTVSEDYTFCASTQTEIKKNGVTL